MKKIILFVMLGFILASCGNKTAEIKIDKNEVEAKLDESKKLINVDSKLKSVEKELKKAGLTGEKLRSAMKIQKEGYEILANLKGDERKKYVFENDILPKLMKNENITPSFCKTNDMDLYLKCLDMKNIDINDVLKELPDNMKVYIEKEFYYQKYSRKTTNLFKKAPSSIAIEQKKKVLNKLFINHILNDKAICGKLPEKDIQNYCKSLFN